MLFPNDHVLDYVDAYLHDALPRYEAKYVQRHCRTCRICQVALEEARTRYEAMQALPVVEAPEELIRSTRRKIEQAPRFTLRPAHAAGLVAAAAAAIIAGVHVYYATLSPSPYDLKVLGQNEWLAGTEASLRVLVVDHHSNQPLEGVPVEIALAGGETQDVIRLASFTTDRFGSAKPRLRLPDWEDGEYQLRVRADVGGTPEVIQRTIKLHRSWRLMLTSDKPVYQPGQVIRVRSLALRRPDLKPVAGQEAVFSVTDPKGNVILRKRDATSRYGIASTECPLATEIIEGMYQVQCAVGNTTSSLSVEVKKYVLPKFKVDVELDQPYYQPGQRVRGTVRAAYFFGKPVGDAEVQIDAGTTVIRPVPLDQATVRTDGAGTARFEFHLPESLIGHEQDAGDGSFTLVVKVRDAAGQEQSKRISRVVTTRPIRVEVIPETGSLVRGVVNTVYFFTGYPDGRPAQTRIAVTGIDRELQTNGLGAASVELIPDADAIRWTIRATDQEGKIGRREVTLECGKAAADFLVRTDKAVYDGGQTMHVLALGGGVQPVMIDLVKDGQTMLTDVIEISAGRGQYQLDLPPELFGTVELCAYRYGGAGLPVRKTRVIYVRQAKTLNIETALDKDQYQPGRRAKLTFTLTDRRGKPVPGALSLAAVDEAVFSVLGQRPGLQRAFFTLEQELLDPVYAIYPWSPDLTTSLPVEGQDLFEQALFARTAQMPGNRDAVLKRLIEEYGENDQRMLEVLQRPDWEQLAESIELPDKLIALLRNERAIHTLSGTTFPEKSRTFEAARTKGLEGVKVAWIVFALVGGAVFLVVFCSRLQNLEVLFVLIIIGILAALMLPAVQSARESSRRGRAMNDLRRLSLVVDASESLGHLPDGDTKSGGPAPPRVRQWFPETLLWRPELITDDDGRASIELDLADSITTWRLSASAVSGEGKLGGSHTPIRVFQPFFVDLNLPVALTRGDEVAVPAVVYNYLDKVQTVELKLSGAEWFEALDEPVQKIELDAGEVRSASFRIRAGKVGRHELQVNARAGGTADAIKRQIEVVPDGRKVEHVSNGTLQQPADVECSVPAEAIEGSAKVIVKIYPSSFSQLVEGLDAIFQRPYGCFEQTSSTTYPNVLALDYLRRTKKSVPAVEAKARQYIHLGCQRLLSFEVDGGGFDWFGRPPANRTLSAYGLMEFEDMARVHDVDPLLIERTRRWLFEQQSIDGSWKPEGHRFGGDPPRGDDRATLSTTAYIAWAVFAGQKGSGQSRSTLNYLLAHRPASIDDPYVLALVCNALWAIDPTGRTARPYLEELDAMKQSSADGKLVWWQQSGTGRTVFYGAGRSGSIETTALAALSMIRAGEHPESTRRALAWLVRQKDAGGTWHSTQATVLALKALLAGTGKPLGGEKERRIEIGIDAEVVRQLVIPADQADVMQQIDLSAQLAEGKHRLTLSDRSDTAAGYQVALSYHVPQQAARPKQEPLSIEIVYDRTELTVDDRVTATATVLNNMPAAAPMVILDLPIPPGFAIEPEDLRKAADSGRIAKYQLTPRSAVVYLRRLPPGEPLELRYRLRATMPVKVTAPPARAYEYYDPDKHVAGLPARLTVLARQ